MFSQTALVRSFRILLIALITLVWAAALDSTYAGAFPGGNDAFQANTANFLGEGVAQGADDPICNPALAVTDPTQLKFTLNRAKIETRDESAAPAARDVASTVPLAPEPPPWAMMAMGAVVLIGVQRLRRRKRA
ncbi:MAG: hypothetical protein DMF76_19965 [Acidobacteria bacterium]|jgi:hypothetical protein|nr:MAG: hypothetical protein DMF76_19965 [Acidobacteriota bacterium]